MMFGLNNRQAIFKKIIIEDTDYEYVILSIIPEKGTDQSQDS